MLTFQVNSWQVFVDLVNEVRRKHGPVERCSLPAYKPKVLFRGQGKSSWTLDTTLERTTGSRVDIYEYSRIALLRREEIESFTDHHWELPTISELENVIKDHSKKFFPGFPKPIYEYLAYLRHHGFPSPLLDWTQSPFIAAYFALIGASEEPSAIFCYVSSREGFKSTGEAARMITTLEPYIHTHKRHFAQKALYTIATEWDTKTKQHYFCTHESIFERNDDQQDILVKVELAPSMRLEGLKNLDDYNINGFTLFNSEEALVKTIAVRQFSLENV